MKTLLLYISNDGQTRAIMHYIAKQASLTSVADVIDLMAAKQIPFIGYHSIIVGASVRYGRFNPRLNQFIQQHAEWLNTHPSAFFSVNLTARKADKSTVETNSYTRKLLHKSPWQPDLCGVFAGALRYPRYRWFDKRMIQFIMYLTGGETDTTKEVEYTNWQQVASFTQSFNQLLAAKNASKQTLSRAILSDWV